MMQSCCEKKKVDRQSDSQSQQNKLSTSDHELIYGDT